MHSHFPSSDIYKAFLYRNEVLKSLMCCDLISFHIFEGAKSFYVATQKVLGATPVYKKGGNIVVQYHGREVMLRISHIAVDIKDIHSSMTQHQFRESKERLQKLCQGKYIISSIDRAHPTSGIRQKLLAYKSFLEQFPRYRTKVVLVQFTIQNSEYGHVKRDECFPKEATLLEEIKQI